MQIIDIVNKFDISGEATTYSPIGNGHINSTFLVNTTSGMRYIIQKINTHAFNDVDSLMNNVFKVVDFLRQNGFESLRAIRTKDGRMYFRDNGECYRIYDYIEDTVCYEEVDNMFLIYSDSKAFGKLHRVLKKFDASKLNETIPDFHNTYKRYLNLLEAVKEDKYDRVKSCLEEIEFIKSKEKDFSVIIDGIKVGEISNAVTHNDPKINNILFDKFSGDIRAIIDLDTIMPGSYLFDFGDSIRSLFTGNNEDSEDLHKLVVKMDIFEAYLKGYLSEMSDILTTTEVELLPFSIYLLTMELAIRFLEDYLRGDIYFKTNYPIHNLIRAKTQIALAKNILLHLDEMNALVAKTKKNIKKMVVLGIDIGGTSIKGGIVNQKGNLFDGFRMAVTKGEDAKKTIAKLIKEVNAFLKKYGYKKEDIFGIGCGVPGIIDSTNGIVTLSSNLKWYNLPLKKMLEDGLGLPVKITNDANAAAIAEAKFGSGSQYKSFLMVTLGTGIGSGIFVDGKLYEGNLGKGGEFGHSLLVMDGRQCGCGRKGCLEAYASANALVNDATIMMRFHKESLMWKILEEKYAGKMNAKIPFDAAKKGDEAAVQLINQYVKYLSEGLINYFNIFRPEAVILSGGIAEQGEFLIKKIRDYCAEHDYGIKLCPPVDIVKSSVGYDSGKIGAAALFMG